MEKAVLCIENEEDQQDKRQRDESQPVADAPAKHTHTHTLVCDLCRGERERERVGENFEEKVKGGKKESG